MTWHLEPIEYQRFERNTLVAVMCQVRFHPILKIDQQIAEYQDRIRATFPQFAKIQERTFSIQPGAAGNLMGEVRDEAKFQFGKVRGESRVLVSTDSLSLETRAHQDRDVFFGDLKCALDALLQVYKPVAPVRVGLRYINSIDKDRIERDLGRPVGWERLIAGPYITPPGGKADLDDTLFVAEITSSMPVGMMTLKYGRVLEQPSGKLRFRFDVDRFLGDPIQTDRLLDQLGGFASDIHSLFRSAAGPDLVEWMRPISGVGIQEIA